MIGYESPEAARRAYLSMPGWARVAAVFVVAAVDVGFGALAAWLVTTIAGVGPFRWWWAGIVAVETAVKLGRMRPPWGAG